MKAIDHTINKTVGEMTEQEYQEQNRFDLREMYYFYDMDWNKVRAIIDELEEQDAERAFDNYCESKLENGEIV